MTEDCKSKLTFSLFKLYQNRKEPQSRIYHDYPSPNHPEIISFIALKKVRKILPDNSFQSKSSQELQNEPQENLIKTFQKVLKKKQIFHITVNLYYN